MSNRKLYVSKSLDLPKEKMLLIADFIIFCAESLPTEGDVCVRIVDNRDNNEIKTTAAYRVGENHISVYAKK